MKEIYTGACQCGAVTFEIYGEFESFFLCHCKRCQKDTGSAHAANLFSSKAKMVWLSGEGTVTTFKLPNTQHTKSFCSNCGAAVPSVQMGGALLVVPAGSLETPIKIKPTAHIHMGSKAHWEDDLDAIKKYQGLPS